MQPREFANCHLPGLERDEAKHSLIVAALGRLAGENPPEMLWWSLGEPGQCAIKAPGYPILLGEVTAAQCHALAEATLTLDYPGVVGADDTARWFVQRADTAADIGAAQEANLSGRARTRPNGWRRRYCAVCRLAGRVPA